MTRLPILRRVGTASAAVLLAAAALTACSSSSGEDAAAGGSGSADSTSGVAAAKAATTKLEQTPTSIGVTTPLKAKPPAGKLIVEVECEVQCGTIANGIKAAAAAVDWQYKSISYSVADTSTLVSALRQALQLRPDAVALQAVPEPAWASVLPDYEAAGVPIITTAVTPANIDKTVIANIAGTENAAQLGKDLANWFIADSNGTGHGVVMTSNDIGVWKVSADAFVNAVKSGCSGCTVSVQNVPLASVNKGGMVSTAISQLQREPDTNYILSMNGPVVTGLAKQLAALGLAKKVKIGGLNANSTNLTNLKAGTEHAWVSYSLTQAGWSTVDAAIRHVEGMDVAPEQSEVPTQLLTPSSSFQIADSVDVPADYASQYKKLWQVQ